MVDERELVINPGTADRCKDWWRVTGNPEKGRGGSGFEAI
jgi:hypothetical protein